MVSQGRSGYRRYSSETKTIRAGRTAGHVVRDDNEIGPARAGNVEELGDPGVGGHRTQAGRIRDVAEMPAVAHARIVPVQLGVPSGLAEPSTV